MAANQKAKVASRAFMAPLTEGVLIGLLILTSALTGILYMHHDAQQKIEDYVRANLARMARAASSVVDGDLHKHLVSPSQMGSREHLTALEPLVRFHQRMPELAYVYTFVATKDGLAFVLDTAAAADRLKFSRPMEVSPIMEPFHSDSAEEDRAELYAVRNGINYVSREPVKDEYGIFLTGLAPIRDSQNNVVAAVGVDLDITEYLRESEVLKRERNIAVACAAFVAFLTGLIFWRIRHQELRAQQGQTMARMRSHEVEERNSVLIQALGQIAYHYDMESDAVEWTGDCHKILGCFPIQMCGDRETWLSCIHIEDRARVQRKFEASIQSGHVYEFEYRFRHCDGHYVWMQDRGVMRMNDQGGPVSMDGFLLDITERKTHEEKLVKAREAAESANRAKSEFLAMMSHEIRTPMNAVIGYIELLLHSQLNEQQKEYLETVRSSGDMLVRLINDILDISKMESDEVKLNPTPMDLRQNINNVTDLYAHAALSKGVEVLTDISDVLPEMIIYDEMRFRQILVNLLGNAIKFTNEGEILVSATEVHEESGPFLKVSVQDTGIGIAPEKLGLLFKPFSQVDSSNTRIYGGSGLGLAICEKLVRISGGAISVKSAPQKGSTFYFQIPLKIHAGMRVSDKNPDFSGDSKKSVVLLEGNAMARSALQKWMEDAGLEVKLASYEDIMKGTSYENTNIIILDENILKDSREESIHIFEMLAKYRAQILFLSYKNDQEIPAHMLDSGGFHFHSKPVRKTDFLNAIKSIFVAKPTASMPKHDDGSSATTFQDFSAKYPFRILVVEDNSINRLLLLRVLERFGYLADAVENGLECVKAVRSKTYDLIFMDIQMPIMDGYQAARELKRMKIGATIIALTAHALTDDREKCLATGIDDYITKPINARILATVIQKWGKLQKDKP